MKILFLAANPLDSDKIKWNEEYRAVEQVLTSEQFDIRQYSGVRISDLQQQLMRHKPDIVHFSGHGNASGEILLEGKDGSAQAVSATQLGKLFRLLRDNVKCVVINACFSESQATAIVEYIDFLIGPSDRIRDSDAIDFARAFYRGLNHGLDIKSAFELGLVELEMMGSEASTALKLLVQVDHARVAKPIFLPASDQVFELINIATVFDYPIEHVEALLGQPERIILRSIGSAEELPDGGETREYKVGKFDFAVNFTKGGHAKGIHIHGFQDDNYNLNHWSVVLTRIGITIVKQPDVVGLVMRGWSNYLGYRIQVFARAEKGKAKEITGVRVYKVVQ